MPVEAIAPVPRCGSRLVARQRRAPFGAASARAEREPALAYALDGLGGARQLDARDEEAMKGVLKFPKVEQGKSPATAGIWIHSDLRSASAQGWLKRVVGRRVAVQTSRWTEEDQPSCEPSLSSDALLINFRATKGLPTGLAKRGPELVTFHLWLSRHLLISAESSHESGTSIVPSLRQSLEEGHGAPTCGQLASAILEGATGLSTVAAREAEDEVFRLKERLQRLALGSLAHRELELLRRDLAQVRYNVIMLRRYLSPQREPLEALLHFCMLPEQQLLDEKAIVACRKMQDRNRSMVEHLDAARSAGEALQVEILALVGWATATSSYRLTVLGSLIGVLGFFSISFDLLSFVERRKTRDGHAALCSV